MTIKQNNGNVTVGIQTAWTRSLIEEVISVLWFIASFLAWSIGLHVVAVLFAIKAAMDSITSVSYAVKEYFKEKEESRD